MINDKELILQLKKDSTKALERLHLQFSAKIYNSCRRFYLNHEDAEEIVQDVFLKIWNTRKKINPDLFCKAYLFKISKNLIIKKLQKKVMHETIDNYITHESLKINTIEDQLFYKDAEELIDNIINKLPPRKRKIFMLNRYQEKSIDEIASELRLSRRTVESHIYQARTFLKSKLNLNIIALIAVFFSSIS